MFFHNYKETEYKLVGKYKTLDLYRHKKLSGKPYHIALLTEKTPFIEKGNVFTKTNAH